MRDAAHSSFGGAVFGLGKTGVSSNVASVTELELMRQIESYKLQFENEKKKVGEAKQEIEK